MSQDKELKKKEFNDFYIFLFIPIGRMLSPSKKCGAAHGSHMHTGNTQRRILGLYFELYYEYKNHFNSELSGLGIHSTFIQRVGVLEWEGLKESCKLGKMVESGSCCC